MSGAVTIDTGRRPGATFARIRALAKIMAVSDEAHQKTHDDGAELEALLAFNNAADELMCILAGMEQRGQLAEIETFLIHTHGG